MSNHDQQQPASSNSAASGNVPPVAAHEEQQVIPLLVPLVAPEGLSAYEQYMVGSVQQLTQHLNLIGQCVNHIGQRVDQIELNQGHMQEQLANISGQLATGGLAIPQDAQVPPAIVGDEVDPLLVMQQDAQSPPDEAANVDPFEYDNGGHPDADEEPPLIDYSHDESGFHMAFPIHTIDEFNTLNEHLADETNVADFAAGFLELYRTPSEEGDLARSITKLMNRLLHTSFRQNVCWSHSVIEEQTIKFKGTNLYKAIEAQFLNVWFPNITKEYLAQKFSRNSKTYHYYRRQ